MTEQNFIRAIVRVIGADRGELIVVVPQWNPHETVRIPIHHLNSYFQREPLRFLAFVNTDVTEPEELKFRNFELAPSLDPNDGLA